LSGEHGSSESLASSTSLAASTPLVGSTPLAAVSRTVAVEESVDKVNDEVAVGEDLGFQRGWWRFERATWVCFVLILAADLAGAFGRGPLAELRTHRAQRHAIDVENSVGRLGTA
jgi:hypothetical protein